ncbi:hypothetical protein Sjap_000015 [Stephania japonica]|uniref:Uncharacterized protein n=1 Tax=Stephania japonica TaxID=461633 RepID=A0AAP0KJU7_9MAGN
MKEKADLLMPKNPDPKFILHERQNYLIFYAKCEKEIYSYIESRNQQSCYINSRKLLSMISLFFSSINAAQKNNTN